MVVASCLAIRLLKSEPMKNKNNYQKQQSNPSLMAFVLIGCLGAILPQSLEAVPIQSSARPLGLDIVGMVQESGSDLRASEFNANHLPNLLSWVDGNLSRWKATSSAQFPLDPSNLNLGSGSDNIRVYFLGEGAGYHNSLGFNLTGSGVDSGDPLLIFPDASSSNRRNRNAPLQIGDFVDLGSAPAGSTLNFFLISNGANGGRNVWSTDKDYNSDGVDHVISYASSLDSYLLFGFEDLRGGGDRNYTDLIFAADIGKRNVEKLVGTSVSDSGSTLAFLSLPLFVFVAFSKSRMRKAKDLLRSS